VLGAEGKGAVELTKAKRKSVIQTITLSKALGTFGGAILCSEAVRRRIIAKSHAFIGSTPLPLPVACATLQSLKTLQTDKSLRRRLFANLNYVRDGLEDRGLVLPRTPGPIIAAKPTNDAVVSLIKRELLKSAIYPPLISYPSGRHCTYLRFVISSEHTSGQLANLVDTLAVFRGLLTTLE
jgi:7-keto-8-aminopelargonate synthetase-like enzyme